MSGFSRFPKSSFAIILFTILLLAALLTVGWVGYRVINTHFSETQLSVDPLPDMRLPVGGDLSLILTGEGFTSDTSVSLLSKQSNDEAVVATLPFDETLSSSLVVGDTLYLGGFNSELKVVSIEYPESPRLLKTNIAGRSMIDITHADGLLYVSGLLGISILQIGEEGLLQHKAEIRTTSAIFATIYKGGYLYAAAGGGGIEIYRVELPEQPSLQTTLNAHPNVTELCAYRNILFALSPKDKEVAVYSLEDPVVPELNNLIKFDVTIFDIAVMNQRLFVATAKGLNIYRIDDGGDLYFLKHVSLVGPAHKLYVGDDKLYAIDSFSRFAIIEPLTGHVDSMPQFSDVRSVAEMGGNLYLTGAPYGLAVVASGKIGPKRRERSMSTIGPLSDLIKYNGRIFAAGSTAGVLAGGPVSPRVEHEFTQISTDKSSSLAINGHHLFVAQPDVGIEVFDITDVDNPVSVAKWSDLPASKVSVFGSYLVVDLIGIGGVSLVDISDLQHPQVIDSRADVDMRDIAVTGDYLLVASREKGLLAFRVLGRMLVRAGRLDSPFPMRKFDSFLSVAAHKGIAYVANGRSGLLVVDVSNPAEMNVLTAISLPGLGKGVYVNNNRLYSINHRAGLTVFSLEDPESPKLLGHLDVSGLKSSVLAFAGDLYLARTNGGVLVVPEIVEAREIRVLSGRRLDAQLTAPRVPGRYVIQLSNSNGSVKLDSTIEIYEPDVVVEGRADSQNL